MSPNSVPENEMMLMGGNLKLAPNVCTPLHLVVLKCQQCHATCFPLLFLFAQHGCMCNSSTEASIVGFRHFFRLLFLYSSLRCVCLEATRDFFFLISSYNHTNGM